MLINFRFRNVRSFYDDTTFSMEATNDNSYRDINAFRVTPKDDLRDKEGFELLKSALIFGPNASGKSNILKALKKMKDFVLNSSAYTANGKPVISDNEPFAFFADADKEDSYYEVEFIENEKYYKYSFSVNQGKVISEELYTTNERQVSLFKRKGDEIRINGLTLAQMKIINIPNNVLFLTIGENYNTPIMDNLKNAVNWFKKLVVITYESFNNIDIYEKNDEYRELALDVLKKADIGINNLNVKKTKIGDHSSITPYIQSQVGKRTHGQIKEEDQSAYDLDLMTTYNIYSNDDEHKVVGKKTVGLFENPDFNSEGTTKLLLYLGYIIASLDRGRVVLVDEIDSRLHFLVSDYLVSLFNSIVDNANNAQLIATAHNTSLMDNGLRRDQIYFVAKDKYGRSELTSLCDYHDVRKDAYYSKKYLAGFYTDLPNFSRGL